MPLLSLLLSWAPAVAAEPAAAPSADDRPHVVLISMDTTRADALSAYGGLPGFEGQVTTPHLDQLAADGIRFERFYTHAPTTLSSHTTMMTGLDPHGHAVVRNGFPLLPDTKTLAQRLGEAGYDTIAVLGAAPLEAAMGLNRGFRVYDDDVDDLLGVVYQRRAEAVVDLALSHVDSRQDGPLFLFVHLYDPHAPYEAPAPFTDRFTDPAYDGPHRDPSHALRPLIAQMEAGTADPAHIRFINGRYLGEVAYMDHHVGRLLDGLQQRGILDRALLVATADHGENLEERPRLAWSHGSDVGLGVMRVPLIVRGFGMPLAERAVVRRQAGMAGLARTIEEVLGLPPALGADAHPFLELLRPGPVLDDDGWPDRPTRPVLLEATKPRSLEPDSGWNNRTFFRGVLAGDHGAYAAPCYDLPWTFFDGLGAPSDQALLPLFSGLMARFDARAPERREAEMAPATIRALQALGYLD